MSRNLCPSVGNRTVLSPLQADVRAPQVTEPSRGECRTGGDLVVAGALGDDAACAGDPVGNGSAAEADQHRRSTPGVSKCAAPVQESSRPRRIVVRNGGQGRDRSLPTSQQEQSGRSSQKTGKSGRSPQGPQRDKGSNPRCERN